MRKVSRRRFLEGTGTALTVAAVAPSLRAQRRRDRGDRERRAGAFEKTAARDLSHARIILGSDLDFRVFVTHVTETRKSRSDPNMDPRFLTELRRIVGASNVLDDALELLTYECDALPHLRQTPAAVALPSSAADVQAIVTLCARPGVPFVARGHGTGLSGGALPVAGGLVIALARLNRILDVDIPNQRVTVEPGVTNLDITRLVAPFGYYYAPDPSSQQVCSIGGNVAENSGGAHCLKYGFTVHHVLGVQAVLPSGDLVHLGGSLAGTPGPDLLGLLVGSEGT